MFEIKLKKSVTKFLEKRSPKELKAILSELPRPKGRSFLLQR